MAYIDKRRSLDPPAPRPRSREVARPAPDFEEVAADDELGSDENELLLRSAWAGRDDD